VTSDDQLRPRVAAGVRWGAIDQIAQVIIRFGTTIVMARLLEPGDFGLFALAMVVGNLAGLIVGLGMSDAVIQRRHLAPGHVSTAFTISAASGVGLAALIAGGSGVLAHLLGERDVAAVLVALSVMVVLEGFEKTPNDMLVRSLLMREYYISSTIATVISAAAGLSVAAGGGGVWALVTMALTEAVVATILGWVFAIRAGVWRPRVGFERARARSLGGFGAIVTGGRIAGYGQTNFDNFVVGRVLGATPLGYYSLAYRTVLLPIVRVSEVMGATVFSAFSGVQTDLVRLRRGVTQATCYIGMVCLPATVGLSVCASMLVPVVLGERWRAAVPVVQVLALGGPALSFARLDSSLYKAVGRPAIGLAMSMGQLAMVVPAYLIGSHWGIAGVATAVVIVGYASLPVFVEIRARLLEQHRMEQITPLAPIALATAAMALAALLAREVALDHLSNAAALAVTVATGVVIYTGALWLLAGGLLEGALTDLRRS
jgi:O-antigen/teichoic acid export membrane protein